MRTTWKFGAVSLGATLALASGCAVDAADVPAEMPAEVEQDSSALMTEPNGCGAAGSEDTFTQRLREDVQESFDRFVAGRYGVSPEVAHWALQNNLSMEEALSRIETVERHLVPLDDPRNKDSFCNLYNQVQVHAAAGTLTLDILDRIQQSERARLDRIRSKQEELPNAQTINIALGGNRIDISSSARGVIGYQVRGKSGEVLASLPQAATGALHKKLVLDVRGGGQVVVDKSVTAAQLQDLVLLFSGGEHQVQVNAAVPCLVLDGGGNAEAGPLLGSVGDEPTFGTMAVYHGTAGNDSWVGTDSGDTAYGYAGADRFTLQSGNDVGYGNENNDCVSSWYGDDWLYGGADQDLTNGRQGYDRCFGDSGAYDDCHLTDCEEKTGCESFPTGSTC